jgi:hypothetical protein
MEQREPGLAGTESPCPCPGGFSHVDDAKCIRTESGFSLKGNFF